MKSNAKGKKPPISAGSEDDDNGILSYIIIF